MGPTEDEDDIIGSINVTPLVDITLVLLIIFMVTASVIVSQAIPIDLPEAATGEEVSSTVVVYLDDKGVVHLDGRPVDEARLVERLSEAREGNDDLRAIISADRDVRHGRFVKVVDAVRRAGIARFAVDVAARGEPDEGEGE